MEPVSGYIVVSKEGKFLSRSLRWVRHRNRDVPGKLHGTRRAWVHTVQTIRQEGEWRTEVAVLFPACFDPVLDCTAIAGGMISYSEFTSGKRDPNTPYWM